MSKTFALIGAGGYIAPKHIEAIKANGCELIEIVDVNDSVGIIDRYFPNCKYSTKLTTKPDYVSICTPNFLHYDHIKEAIAKGCNVICEKPVVLYSHQIDQLKALADLKGVSVNCILQMRLHPLINEIKRFIDNCEELHVSLDYFTPRGDWYAKSWKGDVNKSGGLLFNIGIHLFDILIQLFGDWQYIRKPYFNDGVSGSIDFEHGFVYYQLSTSFKYGKEPYRVLEISGKDFDLANGFTELHTLSYERILEGKGFDITEAKKSIELIERINK
jgi:UDP-N-acetyl-2-amino-2-deoxyglucuronate dehydrogenase